VRLLNDPEYGWEGFYGEIKRAGITIWGAAIDTLENTSRFAKGSPTGPMTVLHLFDQPLKIKRPYEGYVGTLVLPRRVVTTAAEHAILINFRTPRSLVLKAIELAYPGIRRKNIHVWTLGGKSRVPRIGDLWKVWQAEGVHVVEDGWVLPNGLGVFTESGTYAPTYAIRAWKDAAGEEHLFFCDGYAASAEAAQAASLAPMLDLDASLALFTSRFDLPYDREQFVMGLDPDGADFRACLERLTELRRTAPRSRYREMIHDGRDAGFDLAKPTLSPTTFSPRRNGKSWRSEASWVPTRTPAPPVSNR
jgi:hypothetical protein